MSRHLASGLLVVLLAGTAGATEEPAHDPAETFAYVLALVDANFVRPVPRDELVYAAVEEMLDRLDPHSAFLRPRQFRRMREDTSGEFGGLGLVVTKADRGPVVVHEPIEDTPADRAGLQTGDRILSVDGTPTAQLTLDDAVERMKGPRGTAVTLTVDRDGWPEPRDFRLVRDRIRMRSAEGHALEPGFGYVELRMFADHTDHYVRSAIEALQGQNDGDLRGLILDLRGNPGGLLDQAVRVAELFLAGGRVVSTVGRDGRGERLFARPRQVLPTAPMVVLVDANSASAAEILAGALQDHKRALIMGERTFGKGSVQSIIQLDDDSGLKLTVARYYTPAERSIQERGIQPDVTIVPPTDWIWPPDRLPEALLDHSFDYALWSALQTLKAWNRIQDVAAGPAPKRARPPTKVEGPSGPPTPDG